MTRPGDRQQKNRNCLIMNFAVQADHWVKLKESEKRDEYQDLARELKKLWDRKGMVMPILIGTLGTVNKEMLNELQNLEIRGKVVII